MLDNLIFSLNATMPIFLMMVLGYILREIGWLKEPTIGVINKLVFKVFLPALLFTDLVDQDFENIWDGSFVLFCLVVTIISIFIALLISLCNKNKDDRGEMIQAAYRSAAATLGIAYMTNIYDNAAMVSLMIIGSVPLYNIVAVLVLTITSPDNKNAKSKKEVVKRSAINTAKNPIILGIVVGLVWAVFKLPQPQIMMKTVGYLGNVASPLALIGLGASFYFKDMREKLVPVLSVVGCKLLLLCAIFLPAAIWMGFRDEKLVAALIMLGSATTSSSFVMAKNMGHEGKITSSAVMLSTLLASFTLTLWLFILKSMGYI
ncbi:MAG: AEC family transporter [Lachnospiraceae bacterium]|nr:AEC family transporter [Lachnospiraceae bacterium]